MSLRGEGVEEAALRMGVRGVWATSGARSKKVMCDIGKPCGRQGNPIIFMDGRSA